MAIVKNITLPQFTTDYAQLVKLDGQESAVSEGLGFYRALAMLLNGDMIFDDVKGSFGAPKDGESLTKVCKANGWKLPAISKAATVIRTYVAGYETMSHAELREHVIALVTNYGSVHTAYHTIVPLPEPKNGKNEPKSARELLTVALRRHVSDGGDTESFLLLVADVVADFAADGGEEG